MPVWLEIAFAAVPGVLGLIGALWRLGGMHSELKNITERIAPLGQMATDIAYLKGRVEGADIERLSPRPHVLAKARSGLG